ncbi:Protein of unknown function [Gryllus bimaculatus]|nr:Protein of unknown function [Gryllus bimaculatus]
MLCVDRLSDEYADRSSPIIVSITESEAELREEDEDDPAAVERVSERAAAAAQHQAGAGAGPYGCPHTKQSKKRRRLEYAAAPPTPEPPPAPAPSRRALQPCAARDKFASFSEYVASQLRELTPSAQNITMYVINTALFNAAMGLYDDVGGTPGSCTINLMPSAVYIQEEPLSEDHK